MNSKFQILSLVCFIFLQNVALPQNLNKADSLELALTLEHDPEKKIEILAKLTSLTKNTDPDLALEFANQTLDLASEFNKPQKQILAWIQMSDIYLNKSDYRSTMEYAHNAKNLSKDLGLEREYAMSLNLISLSYYNLGNYIKSSELNFEALKIVERLGYKRGILNMLNRIGSDYSAQENNDKAFEYFSRSLARSRV